MAVCFVLGIVTVLAVSLRVEGHSQFPDFAVCAIGCPTGQKPDRFCICRPTNPCDGYYCEPGTYCTLHMGWPLCRAVDPCDTKHCSVGSYCTVLNGIAVCRPNNPPISSCDTKYCEGGTQCIVSQTSGLPICVAIEPPTTSPCYYKACDKGSKCIASHGVGICVPMLHPFEACLLPKKTGPCYASMLRYYYNYHIGRCQSFIYGGCLANPNNFETLQECKATCPCL